MFSPLSNIDLGEFDTHSEPDFESDQHPGIPDGYDDVSVSPGPPSYDFENVPFH